MCIRDRPRTHKHCRPCAIHANDTEARARTCLHGLFSVEHSYQPGTFQCTSSCNNTLRCRSKPSKNDKITSCLGSDGQHAPRTHKHCRPCARHAHATPLRARTRLHGFHSVGISIQPVPPQFQNKRKNNYFWIWSIVVSFDCTWRDLFKIAVAHYFLWMLTILKADQCTNL